MRHGWAFCYAKKKMARTKTPAGIHGAHTAQSRGAAEPQRTLPRAGRASALQRLAPIQQSPTPHSGRRGGGPECGGGAHRRRCAHLLLARRRRREVSRPPSRWTRGRRDGAVLGEATRPPTHKDRLGRRGWRQRKRYKPTNRIALASATTSGGTASKGMQQRGSLRRANGQLASRCAADGTAGEGGPSHGRRAQLGSRWGRTNGTAAPTQPPPPIPCEALMPSAALRPPAERRAAAAHSANRRAIGLTPPPPPLGDQPRNSAQDVFSAASLIW